MLQVSVKNFERVIVEDCCPDLSDLGKYVTSPEPNVIDRQELGDWKRGEFRYFLPAMTGEETGNPESPMEDYRRMEAYSNGEWQMIGIRARVTVRVPLDYGIVIYHRFESAGIYGIESDSDESYLDEMYAEECAELRQILAAFNVEVTD